MKILLTGGAGYIGSTIANACVDQGIEPIILDDFSKGRRDWAAEHTFYEGDVADGALIDSIFAQHPDISAVIHCAAKIVVPESVEQPVDYYANNVGKGISMLQHLRRNGCERIIFSSSASIYSVSADFTVDENSAVAPTSPYANSKAIFENVLRDGAAAGEFRAIALGISTRSAPTRSCAPACRTRCPATFWASWLPRHAPAFRSPSPAWTGRPGMGPASATSSTCGISRSRTSPP